MLYAWHEGTELIDGEEVFSETGPLPNGRRHEAADGAVVRLRAMTLPEVVLEIASTTLTERGEDQRQETALLGGRHGGPQEGR